MKKIIKIILCLTVALTLAFSAFAFVTSAASASISFGSGNKTSYKVGDTVTVNVSFKSGGASLYGFTGEISYDSSVMQFVSGGTNSGSTVRVVDSNLSGETGCSYSFTFKAVKSGSNYFKFSGEGSDGASKITANTGYTVTVTGSPSSSSSSSSSSNSSSAKANNAKLSSIKLSNGSLSPKFSANTTSYTVFVANSVSSCKITATTQDKNATYSISGSDLLSVGSNTRKITVTAEDGTKKTYTITIKRGEADTSSDTSSDSSSDNSSDSSDTSSENTSSDEIPTDNLEPMDVVIGNEVYTVLTDKADLPVPEGYAENKVLYNNEEITVIESQTLDYVLYTLKNKETEKVDYFTYDAVTDEFTLLPYIIINSKMFIFADDGVTGEPEGYRRSEVNLGNTSVEAYLSDNNALSDFYIAYCFVEGKYGYYRYDSVENTMQRAPDFAEIAANAKLPDNEDTEVMSSIKDFGKISGYGKAVIIVIAIIIICVIVLIVLVIVRFVKLRQQDTMDDIDFINDSLFDEINIEDNSQNTESDNKE